MKKQRQKKWINFDEWKERVKIVEPPIREDNKDYTIEIDPYNDDVKSKS